MEVVSDLYKKDAREWVMTMALTMNFVNREGRICGRCKNNTGPPVYSCSLECVPCLETEPLQVCGCCISSILLGSCQVEVIVTSGN